MRRSHSPQYLAKMLAYVLGRRPDEFGLVPDPDGFVKTKDLLKALHEEEGWGYVNESHLREVLMTVPGRLVEIDAHRIRVRQREPFCAESAPERLPKLLFVPIRRRAYPCAHANGILPSSHPQVVLTPLRGLAERLGRRIDPDPVILEVNVRLAEEHGAAFDRFGEDLFLADQIPAGCFSGPPLPSETPENSRQPQRTEGTSDHAAAPGSFLMDMERAAAQVPESLKRRTAGGRKIDPKRLKRGKWTRETPPWKKN